MGSEMCIRDSTDLVENRVVGMKSRGVYETPGGSILYRAHRDLEYLCLDRATTAFSEVVRSKYADLIYRGEWFTPLREAIAAYVAVSYTHLRAHETDSYLVCRLLLEKKKKKMI